MIKIAEKKELTERQPIKDVPLPDRVYIPLIQHVGRADDLIEVKVGDIVRRGQKLAYAEAAVSSPVHSSITGKVVAIREHPHPVLGTSKAVVIERDTNIKEEDFSLSSDRDIDALAPEELRQMIREAGIVGMGGAAFPAHIKLSPPKPVDSFILNGAECEPYLTSDARLMIEKANEILKGVELIAKILEVKNVYIAIEENKPEAIKAFKSLIAYRLSVIGRTANTEHRTPKLVILKSQYPQGAEKQLIYSILKRKVPLGKLPFEVGVVVHNVATGFAIYEAVYRNKPLFERVVTLTGSILKNPANLKVRIGTPIGELISLCGLKEKPAKIIMGGPMMGLAQFTEEVPVIKGTGGILVLGKDELFDAEEEICIRCGSCIRNCPMGLEPALISLSVSKDRWDLARLYGALDCIECGVCTYVCPAKRQIVQAVKLAKLKNR